MPFNGLGFKKIRRYDVAKKELFLLPVQLLDNTYIECTTHENSTGLELLHHIAQRLNVREWEYFGLKFINKHMQYQWLSLEEPLKNQLCKCAQELFVKFSVRFYIRNINQLTDDCTRYQFFLQLRNEIIEGALLCSAEQAVLLASYSLQSGLGDFDVDRHSPRHLKEFYLLPKRMSVPDQVLYDLLIQVSDTHQSLRGMSPSSAEIRYIIEAQNLEGYGEEYYSAVDGSGNDLLLGTSHVGITIKHPTGRPLLSISWGNLKSVSLSKRRSICLECVGTGRSNQRLVQIFMENADFAAYVLKNIIQQQEFHVRDALSASVPDDPSQSRKHDALSQVKTFNMMFRPDQLAASVQEKTFPDIVQSLTERPTQPETTRESSSALIYRETPRYEDVINSTKRSMHKRITVGTVGQTHLDPMERSIMLNKWPDNNSPDDHQLRSAQTTSTPELRNTTISSNCEDKQSVSTPDLLHVSAVPPGIFQHKMHKGLDDLTKKYSPTDSADIPTPPSHPVVDTVKADLSPRPSPAVISKDSRRLDLEQRLFSGNLLIEFEQIPKKRQVDDSCSVAMMPENKERNRYSNLLPYDDTRINLTDPPRKNVKGYINASEIILKCQDLDRRYIAAQDPIPTVTSEDFLSMLSMTAKGLVVVLSDAPSVPWASFIQGEKEVSFQGFNLRRESVSQASGFLTVCFWLYDRRTKQSRRKIWAIHFFAWNDQGVPDSADEFCQMMQELESLRMQFHNNTPTSSALSTRCNTDSVIVVCPTGSGRTGMLILFDFMRLCLDHNQNVDLARILTHMRLQRMHMVQTVSQYRFVYTALILHLAGSRLI